MRNILFVLLLIILTACTSIPSDSEIKIQVAKSVLHQGGEKIFALENFHKLNGVSVDESTYIAEVQYDLVFRKGLDELTAELKEQSSQSPLAALGAGMEILGQLMQYGQFKAGDRLPRHEKHKLIKTEQGWRLAKDFTL
ncbi:MAG: hypothetical protein J7K75_04390 [Desulfuromonas sp.]|nr:hypothetical protein [Desulfuromonas sp.]